VGLSHVIDSKKDQGGVEAASVGAVMIDVDLKGEEEKDSKENFEKTKKRKVKYVYRIDGDTSKVLSMIPPAMPGEEIATHFFFHEEVQNAGGKVVRNDWFAIGATLLKIVEVITLWYRGATVIWWVTALPWSYYFTSACILQFLSQGRGDPDIRQIDLLCGELPSALHPGGSGKLLLGLPSNPRYSLAWKLTWTIGALLICISTIGTFLSLNQERALISYIWFGFQVLFLVLRILVFELLPSGPIKRGPIVAQRWQNLSLRMKHRVMHLVVGLAAQQIATHPRRANNYQEDLLSISALSNLFFQCSWSLTETLPYFPNIQNLEIIAIVGDTFLRSSIWLRGSRISNSDVYDSALILLSHKTQNEERLYAIPCVRILAKYFNDPQLSDKEASGSHASTHDPRGTSNLGYGVQWVIWFPILLNDEKEGWIEVTGLKVLGSGAAQWNVLSNEGLAERLASGTLGISMLSVEEVRRSLGASREAARLLMGLVEDLELC